VTKTEKPQTLKGESALPRYHLLDLVTFRGLAGQEESFDELALATYSHARKAFEPFALGDFRLGVEPAGEVFKLRSRDITLLNAVKQMPEEWGREVVTANARHGTVFQTLDPIEASSDALTQARSLFQVTGGSQLPGQQAEFFRA